MGIGDFDDILPRVPFFIVLVGGGEILNGVTSFVSKFPEHQGPWNNMVATRVVSVTEGVEKVMVSDSAEDCTVLHFFLASIFSAIKFA